MTNVADYATGSGSAKFVSDQYLPQKILYQSSMKGVTLMMHKRHFRLSENRKYSHEIALLLVP